MISLNPIIPVIGFGCLIFFAAWVLWERDDSWLGAYQSLTTGLLAFATLLAVPMCLYMTWHQVGAKERLLRERLPVSEDLGYVIGAQGGRAPRLVWRFETRAKPQTILAFYERQALAAGWKSERTKEALLLHGPDATFAAWTERHGDDAQIIIQKRVPKPVK
jgi:hypothetical protein